jgi:hypothetical protein
MVVGNAEPKPAADRHLETTSSPMVVDTGEVKPKPAAHHHLGPNDIVTLVI